MPSYNDRPVSRTGAMTTFVTGATSQIGHFLLPLLMDRGEQVIALSRRPRRTGRANECWVTGALGDAAVSIGSAELDSIISFGPMEELADWISRQSITPGLRLVATSSMSAESKRESAIAAEREVSARLRAGEARLIDRCERHGILWTILRPTLIYGAGLDRSLSPIARRALRWRVFPVPAGNGLRQPIHAEDVAMAALHALRSPEAAGRILPLGGGERLRVSDMFRRVRDSLPAATLPLTLPAAVLSAAARLQPGLRGPLARLETDLVADHDESCRILGIQPRGFRPTAAAWGLTA